MSTIPSDSQINQKDRRKSGVWDRRAVNIEGEPCECDPCMGYKKTRRPERRVDLETREKFDSLADATWEAQEAQGTACYRDICEGIRAGLRYRQAKR